eukprot:COSAG06_NODE_43177_length_374_cov_1.072727_1_plen_91_part_10
MTDARKRWAFSEMDWAASPAFSRPVFPSSGLARPARVPLPGYYSCLAVIACATSWPPVHGAPGTPLGAAASQASGLCQVINLSARGKLFEP